MTHKSDTSNADSDLGRSHGRTLHEHLLKREKGLHRFLESVRGREAEQGEIPWWGRVLLRVMPYVVSWTRLKTGVEYRWLRRQPCLEPRDSKSFIGCAERLIELNHGSGNHDELTKLLVNASLEDLRVPFAHRWRLRSVRRTAYCVAVLNGAQEDNVVTRLIEAIIDVRVETGAFDPLLTIVCGGPLPQTKAVAQGTLPKLGPDTLEQWQWKSRCSTAAREHASSTWYLPLAVPPLPVNDNPGGGSGGNGGNGCQLGLKDVPWWATRRTVWSVVSLLVAVAAVTPLVMLSNYQDTHCGLPWSNADAATLRTAPDGQCVGVAPNGFDFNTQFNTQNASFARTMRTIAALNRRAEQLHHDRPSRPIVSLVELAALSDDRDGQHLDYVNEQFQGAAVAQRIQLDKSHDNDPLIRLLPASPPAAAPESEPGRDPTGVDTGQRAGPTDPHVSP